MRLSEAAVSAINRVFAERIQGAYRLYLHGSRTDDALRGGDIDLLVLVNESGWEALAQERFRLVAELKSRIGDQRIDLTIKNFGQKDAFVQDVLASAILLAERD